jgi:hypothetical protein
MADYIHELADDVFEVLDRIEARPINGDTALALLQAVYRDPEVPLPTRIKCAAAALPFESPKLVATAHLDPADFAVTLEKAIIRSGGVLRLIEQKD